MLNTCKLSPGLLPKEKGAITIQLIPEVKKQEPCRCGMSVAGNARPLSHSTFLLSSLLSPAALSSLVPEQEHSLAQKKQVTHKARGQLRGARRD
jgi:hypothetical protein